MNRRADRLPAHLDCSSARAAQAGHAPRREEYEVVTVRVELILRSAVLPARVSARRVLCRAHTHPRPTSSAQPPSPNLPPSNLPPPNLPPSNLPRRRHQTAPGAGRRQPFSSATAAASSPRSAPPRGGASADGGAARRERLVCCDGDVKVFEMAERAQIADEEPATAADTIDGRTAP